MGIQPTGYVNKATAVDNDSVWGYDSEGIANVNFTMSVILAYVFSNTSTSNISEGTNLYYTETRVGNNSTVVGLGNDKSDKTNVLELDNTTVYTPTDDYHPATKKFVEEQPVPTSSETQQGLVERNTAAETLDGTDTTRYSSSKHIRDYYGQAAAGTTFTMGQANTERTSATTDTYVKVKDITSSKFGSTTVSFQLKSLSGAVSFARVYINDVAVGTERTVSSTTYSTFTENFNINYGDKIQLYYKGQTAGAGESAVVRNFNVKYSAASFTATINLD